jgi:hypothetical protein
MTPSKIVSCLFAASLAAALLPAQGIVVQKRAQEPAPAPAASPELEQHVQTRLAEVIAMLEEESLTAEEREKAQAKLKEIMAKMKASRASSRAAAAQKPATKPAPKPAPKPKGEVVVLEDVTATAGPRPPKPKKPSAVPPPPPPPPESLPPEAVIETYVFESAPSGTAKGMRVHKEGGGGVMIVQGQEGEEPIAVRRYEVQAEPGTSEWRVVRSGEGKARAASPKSLEERAQKLRARIESQHGEPEEIEVHVLRALEQAQGHEAEVHEHIEKAMAEAKKVMGQRGEWQKRVEIDLKRAMEHAHGHEAEVHEQIEKVMAEAKEAMRHQGERQKHIEVDVQRAMEHAKVAERRAQAEAKRAVGDRMRAAKERAARTGEVQFEVIEHHAEESKPAQGWFTPSPRRTIVERGGAARGVDIPARVKAEPRKVEVRRVDGARAEARASEHEDVRRMIEEMRAELRELRAMMRELRREVEVDDDFGVAPTAPAARTAPFGATAPTPSMAPMAPMSRPAPMAPAAPLPAATPALPLAPAAPLLRRTAPAAASVRNPG